MPRDGAGDGLFPLPPASPRRAAPAVPVTPARGNGTDVYQLKITLKSVRPPVWRRVLVPGRITLASLHDVVQVAMGWTDSHLHQWEVDGQEYGTPSPDWPDPTLRSERRVRLDAVAVEGTRLEYWYDFGDDWRHDVRVEQVRGRLRGERLPRCVAGRRACPPEDVGGPWGYAELLAAQADPSHPEHESFATWAPGFRAAAFDVAETDALLRRSS